ncbi:MAG: metallopeptidase family protein [Actinomycetaceae bacterium]|nr:metallopeptidase family protein [Actinomycetaceae bacterium]
MKLLTTISIYEGGRRTRGSIDSTRSTRSQSSTGGTNRSGCADLASSGRAGSVSIGCMSDTDEPFEISEDDFAALVEDAIDALPESMVDRLDNVAIFIEDDSPAGEPEMLGVYEGIDLIERGDYGFGDLPDRIVLFRNPLMRISRDEAELREQIHITLVHEIAHFFGIDDDHLDELGWG